MIFETTRKIFREFSFTRPPMCIVYTVQYDAPCQGYKKSGSHRSWRGVVWIIDVRICLGSLGCQNRTWCAFGLSMQDSIRTTFIGYKAEFIVTHVVVFDFFLKDEDRRMEVGAYQERWLMKNILEFQTRSAKSKRNPRAERCDFLWDIKVWIIYANASTYMYYTHK